MPTIESEPQHDAPAPDQRQLRQERDAEPSVLAALCVMGRGRQHRVWPLSHAFLNEPMECRAGHAEAPRIAADLVQSQQAEIAVEGRILEGLRHDRPGHLLELHCGAEHIVWPRMPGQVG